MRLVCIILVSVTPISWAFCSSTQRIRRGDLAQNFVMEQAYTKGTESKELVRKRQKSSPFMFTSNTESSSFTQLHVSKVRNMAQPVTLAQKVTFVPRWILWQMIRCVTFVQRCIFRAFVTTMAGIVTAVIIDPSVNRAFAHAMKDGLNLFLTQPTIKQRLLEFQKNLSEQDPSLAKPIGENFPKLIFNFMYGLIVQGLDEEIEKGQQRPEQTRSNGES